MAAPVGLRETSGIVVAISEWDVGEAGIAVGPAPSVVEGLGLAKSAGTVASVDTGAGD